MEEYISAETIFWSKEGEGKLIFLLHCLPPTPPHLTPIPIGLSFDSRKLGIGMLVKWKEFL